MPEKSTEWATVSDHFESERSESNQSKVGINKWKCVELNFEQVLEINLVILGCIKKIFKGN